MSVLHLLHLQSREFLQQFIVLVAADLQNGVDQTRGHDQNIGLAVLPGPDPGVLESGVYGHRHIGGNGPGSGGPDHNIGVLFTDHREFDINGVVGLIPVLHFRVRYGCLAARAPVHDSESPLQEVILVRLFQCPPGGLKVLVLQGHVRVVPVEPCSQDLELDSHVIFLAKRELLAPLYELVDTVGLDIFLITETEGLLYLDLDGQAVHIPARPVLDLETVHGLVAEH